VMVGVRERGVKALTEPDMLRRLAGCDEAAKAEINRRVAALLRAIMSGRLWQRWQLSPRPPAR